MPRPFRNIQESMVVLRRGFTTGAALRGKASTTKSIRQYKAQVNKSLDPLASEVKPIRRRKGFLIIGGLALYTFTAYGAYLYFTSQNAKIKGAEMDVPDDVSHRYNDTAKHFDSEVDQTEKLMGIGWLRQSLAKRASGNVLEVSVGTGRNTQYYDLKKCKSITMVDQSAEMVEIAKKKFDGMVCNSRIQLKC